METNAEGRGRVLVFSTLGFTLLFAVWLMFGVLGIPIRAEFGLSEVQFGWLTAVAILSGSILRLLFGILSDIFGGRRIFTLLLLFTAIPAFMVSHAESYRELLVLGFFTGLAGNSFAIGIAWNSVWFPKNRQGLALGVFGAGNVGASLTKFIGPALIALVPAAGLFGLTPGGWRFVPFLYSILLVLMALVLWFGTPSHDIKPGKGKPLRQILRPLRHAQVWRFSFYYVVVFGAYVALSVWLPKYYVDVYQIPLKYAALLTALFIFPASLLRPFGGWLSDLFGARRIMYWVFGGMLAVLALLSLPNGSFSAEVPRSLDPSGLKELFHFRLGPTFFTVLVALVGVGMGVGKAAVYKCIPEYFPKDVGAVGGLVGLLGALGGFFLPPLFAYCNKATGIPQTTFWVLFIITGISLVWLHVTVTRMMDDATPQLHDKFDREDKPA